uniref:Uncharacterized protein n=1 Tax=Wuchereria bancrofti TaxID=6293 RepID=A0A1I8EK62_WUCBA
MIVEISTNYANFLHFSHKHLFFFYDEVIQFKRCLQISFKEAVSSFPMPALNSRQKFSQESKGQETKWDEKEKNSIFQKNFVAVDQKNNGSTTSKASRTIDQHFSIDEHHVIYTGISNEIATKLVLMLMGFMVTLILLCIFLILSIYIYYKEKDEELFTDNKNEPAKVKVDKAHSPYIITPEQKITQQLLSTEMVTSIGCSADDIAQLLRYIALYGELSEVEIYQTPLTFIRLVVRGKTKFDKDDSKRKQKSVPKSESKLGLHNEKEKNTRGHELSNRLNSGNEIKRSSRRGNAMRKGKKEKNRKKKSSK